MLGETPYGKGCVLPTLTALRDGGWLDKDALVVIEESVRANIDLPEGFSLCEARRLGVTRIVIARSL